MGRSARPNTTQLNRLGRHIRAAREKRGLLGVELARLCGVNPSAVSRWENGREPPTLAHLLCISKVTQERVSFLVGDNMYGLDTLDSLGRRLAVQIGSDACKAILHMSGVERAKLMSQLGIEIPVKLGRPVKKHSHRSLRRISRSR